MTAIRVTPAIIATWLLAAHFVRSGDLMTVMLLLFAPGLLFVRRRWVARLYQTILLFGMLMWIDTTYGIVQSRIDDGEPWTRLVLILGGVALFTGASALIFETRALKERFARGGSVQPEQS